ncbi:MAG TPA: DUF2207 domain-containing protein, partial [Candidatus Angelobacter sp.]|nr:DUF2207 domain-containing protein [Candidatus Angelobacter sp.]
MKRVIFCLITIILASIVHINFASASVNDFVIRDFQADYYLDKDNEGRSTLRTVESITADFPEIDQNHGIERAIVSTYNDHPTSLKIESVTDQTGKNWSYSTRKENDNLILQIGDKDIYVHGLQTYVITYNQHDVTNFFSDTNSDEFYWNVNGTGWYQPFDKITARLHIGLNIVNTLTDDQACYSGASGSTNVSCVITRSGDVIAFSATTLEIGENLTIAVGFKPQTFSEYRMSFVDYIKKY